jgi:hypothetical protein
MGIFDKPERPVVRLKMTTLELVVEAVALAGIVANVILFIYYWPKLPDVAVAGFGSAGLSRSAMFSFVTLLPMIIYVGATLLGLFPSGFKYPVKITQDNAAREYRLAANMLRVIKAEVVVCMLILEWVFINIALGEDMTISLPFMILFFGLLALTILFFVYEMRKQK